MFDVLEAKTMKEPFDAKASPKTLKQQTRQEIWEEYEQCPEGPNGEDSHLFDMLEDKYVSVVNLKEWLTQKLPKITDENTLTRYNCINELLEELNQ